MIRSQVFLQFPKQMELYADTGKWELRCGSDFGFFPVTCPEGHSRAAASRLTTSSSSVLPIKGTLHPTDPALRFSALWDSSAPCA